MAWGIRKSFDKLRTARRERAEARERQLDAVILRLAADAAARGLPGVHLYQLRRATGISPSDVAASLIRLQRMWCLQRIDLGESHSPRVYYFITHSGYWCLHQLDAAR